MKTFPATLIPVIEIHHTVLAKVIQAAYGFSISLENALGHKADVVEFDVRGELLKALVWQQRAAAVRRGKRTGDIPLLLNMLVVDGHIHAGVWRIRMAEKRRERVADVKWFGKLINLRIAVG